MFKTVSLVALFAATAAAQLNLLTPREAVQIVGLIPEVAEARKQGSCPQFAASFGDTVDKLGVQVRHGCGPYAGQLISNYGVDLRTGAAFQQDKVIKDPALDALVEVLLKQAGRRGLSDEECRCLALEAAKSLPGWGGPGREVSIEQSGVSAIHFRARLRAEDPPLVNQQSLTIDRTTARVHDDKTGMEVVSPSLASVTSMMLTLRAPTLLSEIDALNIARQIPEVQAQASKPCSVFSVGGPLSWDDIFVGVQSHCEGAPDLDTLLVGVNAKTGVVTDPKHQKHFDSPGAVRFAQERLAEITRQRIDIRANLNTICRPQ